MCGRFTQTKLKKKNLADLFDLADAPDWPDRYNVAPTQPVAAVRQAAEGRELVTLRWGLVPSWSADPKTGYRLINARSETVAKTPAFRAAFKQRRCLIPISGYYEWQKTAEGKQPFYIHPKGAELFTLAGLWEHWQGADGEIIESCSILTTAAADVVRFLHERMPVILQPQDFDLWLDPQVQKPELLQPLLRPFREVASYPVSTYVNSPRHEGPRCIEPLAA
jgi:putative SOS response-associated peptidase YedK